MLRPFGPGQDWRETMCGRYSSSPSTGKQILTFREDGPAAQPVHFEATLVEVAVTCRRCRKVMGK